MTHEDTLGGVTADNWPKQVPIHKELLDHLLSHWDIMLWLTYTWTHTPFSLFLSVFKIVIPHFKLGFTLMNAGESMRKENRIMLLGVIIKMGTERRTGERRRGGQRGSMGWCQRLIKFMPSCHFAESKQALQSNMTSLSRLSVVPRGHRS